ncbi:MAG: Glycyl-glycine endopeptidase ALE-1, partial [Candidatus Peregrinibacteria bacterium GW2011_GWA2_47_7]
MEDEQYTTENSGEKQHELLLFERQTLFVIIGISVLTLLVYFFGTDAKDLFTNIVTPLPQHQAFDGTVYPIKKVPDWVHLTEEERIASYDLIPEEKYIGVPRYSPARLATSIESLEWNNPEHDEIRNEKITYSVPYMGSYKLDGKEYAGSHAAVDIKVPQGTPIYAIANGVVTKVSESLYGFGHHIVIQHNDVPDPDSTEGASTTLHSSYSHLSKVLVAERDVVTKGQLIGLSGSTGTATTPHMHFQIDRDQAGWHPYWPFTSKEAAEAGLSFFQAINNGLGKENGLAYTVHPLVYVQKYLKETKRLAVAGPVETAVTPETSSAKISPRLTFLIEPIVQELFVGETITLKI